MDKKKRIGQRDEAPTLSSPPCSLHSADPVYQGYLDRDQVLALLNELLEAERAGAKVARAITAEAGDTLEVLAADEARFCAMLTRHIAGLEGDPSQRTGAFREKVLALEGLDSRLRLLNRGQAWVVRKLKEALPRIADETLHADLADMLSVHEDNIRKCDEVLGKTDSIRVALRLTTRGCPSMLIGPRRRHSATKRIWPSTSAVPQLWRVAQAAASAELKRL